MDQNCCACMHRLVPGGVGLSVQVAFAQLDVMPGLRLGRA